MFETTKPATPGTNRTISAGNSISFWVFYRDRSFLFVKKLLLVLHPDSQQSFPFLFLSASLFIDFEVLELIPAVDVAFIFVYFLSWLVSVDYSLIPAAPGNTAYSLDSFKIFDYLKLLFSV